jgi:hypothetical protein
MSSQIVEYLEDYLTKKEMAIFLLHHLSNTSFEEISEQFDITETEIEDILDIAYQLIKDEGNTDYLPERWIDDEGNGEGEDSAMLAGVVDSAKAAMIHRSVSAMLKDLSKRLMEKLDSRNVEIREIYTPVTDRFLHKHKDVQSIPNILGLFEDVLNWTNVWLENGHPLDEMQSFIQKEVLPKVNEMMVELKKTDTPMVEVFENADQLFAYSIMTFMDVEFLNQRVKLVSMISPEASALALGMLGIHLRKDPHSPDIENVGVLIEGVLPELKSLIEQEQMDQAKDYFKFILSALALEYYPDKSFDEWLKQMFDQMEAPAEKRNVLREAWEVFSNDFDLNDPLFRSHITGISDTAFVRQLLFAEKREPLWGVALGEGYLKPIVAENMEPRYYENLESLKVLLESPLESDAAMLSQSDLQDRLDVGKQEILELREGIELSNNDYAFRNKSGALIIIPAFVMVHVIQAHTQDLRLGSQFNHGENIRDLIKEAVDDVSSYGYQQYDFDRPIAVSNIIHLENVLGITVEEGIEKGWVRFVRSKNRSL